ncbi:MmgE/PrpD family protein [Roseovarius albus]|uniref:MmgE/PrpD family protein n=1 Tax=Roseovarius albus TaxID=1247867 RepID=A0A1X6Y895_9RHOB|nr:MmgE/PrpD family protein [Roseovarius albus]SLN13239.1 MmgE/PrpD family protein [Roseovarius albus]
MTGAALTRLAAFAAKDPLEADAKTLAVLRAGVVDTLGCIHAGVETDVAIRARQAVQSMSNGGPAQVIGTNMQAPRPQAAFLNAVAGHALDFDDWEIPGNTHPTVVLLPSLLAVAGPSTSGKDLVRAYLAGFEVIARLGEALNFEHYDAGWHSTATLGAPGAAAACARLMGLSVDQTAHTMSFAISAASGYTCQFGSSAKPVQAGFAARAGVEAACLAQSGLIAQVHVLDHPRGMAALMNGLVPERLEAALSHLGKEYALSQYGLVLKPWPSCGYTHRIMTSALALREQVPLDQVARIDLFLPDFHAAVLPFQRPTSRAEALFSLPFVAAMGLIRGALTLADLKATRWAAPDIKAMIGKTHVHAFSPIHPELNYSDADPDRMVVTLSDGRVVEEQCPFPLGAPQAPMSDAQLWAKFNANLGASADDPRWSEQLRDWPTEPDILNLLTKNGDRR